jgi:hypothetical protein
MNFITLTNKYDRKIVIRVDTIMSMEEVVAPQMRGESEAFITYIMYGEFGTAQTHGAYVKEPTAEIVKRIEAPYSGEIDREDTYPGLWDICEKLEAHAIGPTVAVAVIQTFIENEIVIAVERAVALDRVARGDDEDEPDDEPDEIQMEREESEMIDRKIAQERAREQEGE